jgi:hypothetical protein
MDKSAEGSNLRAVRAGIFRSLMGMFCRCKVGNKSLRGTRGREAMIVAGQGQSCLFVGHHCTFTKLLESFSKASRKLREEKLVSLILRCRASCCRMPFATHAPPR